MMSVAVRTAGWNCPDMARSRTDSATELRQLGRALSVLRRRTDLSQAAAAERLGITPQAWQRYEAGERQALLRTDLQERLTAALGFDRQALTEELALIRGEPSPTRSASIHPFPASSQFGHLSQSSLPIRGPVQAGAWLVADDPNEGPQRFAPAARDPRFPTATQWLSQVYGDSMDELLIFEGDLAQLVDASEIGYSPRTGDLVEVERTRLGGQLRELTIKQVEVCADNSVRLWPRSTNARWKEPLHLETSNIGGEEFEVRIRGLLVATVRRF